MSGRTGALSPARKPRDAVVRGLPRGLPVQRSVLTAEAWFPALRSASAEMTSPALILAFRVLILSLRTLILSLSKDEGEGRLGGRRAD
jgi:hypothetical protein